MLISVSFFAIYVRNKLLFLGLTKVFHFLWSVHGSCSKDEDGLRFLLLLSCASIFYASSISPPKSVMLLLEHLLLNIGMKFINESWNLLAVRILNIYASNNLVEFGSIFFDSSIGLSGSVDSSWIVFVHGQEVEISPALITLHVSLLELCSCLVRCA